MKDDDLAKTMCLDEDLSELNSNNETLREKKYSNVQEVLDASVNDLKDKEVDENGDVIEDTKPFELETLKLDDKTEEAETKVEKDIEEKVIEKKKEGKLAKLKKKWHELSKKKKVLFIILFILVMAIIVTTIVLLVIKANKKEEIVEPKEEDIIVIKDNYIYKNGSLEFLDKDDNVIGTYECENKDEKLCYVAYNDTKEDNLLREINLYEDESYILERLKFFNDQYAFVFDNKSEEDNVIELVDFKNNKVVDNYQLVKHYQVNNKDYIIVKNDMGNYCLYEVTNEGLVEIIKKDYKYLGIIPNKETNYVIGELSTGSYLIDYTGKEISKLISKKIFNYNEDYIVTVDNDGYSLYDYKNEQKLTGYKYIGLDNDYILLVDNFNKLYFKDKELNKVNEEGIQLNSDEFITKNIYSKEGIKLQTKYSFTTNYNEDNITIILNNQEQNGQLYEYLNLSEINYNKTSKYYSYLNEKLYFYEDENKNTLIGSYTCSNKNSDIKEGEMLSNCHPAFDTVFEENDMTFDTERNSMIPIYNKKYVFIEDSSSNSKTIKLYDLTNNKEISTYEDVNTYTANNNGVLSHANINSVNVIAKNKSGKYGMINITTDQVNSVYTFNYGYMEMIAGKILALNEDNKWMLLYSKTSTSALFDGKIRGFIGDVDYFKVKQNNLYYVYDADGNKISETGYKYVELYNNMYAGVSENNELMLYNYSGKTLIDDVVKLYSTNYYGKEANAFMIATGGSEVVIEVLNEGTYNSVHKNIIDVSKTPVTDQVVEPPE